MPRWSRAYKNRLPDKAFLYIEPGGTIDETGRTRPRSLRHFPVYDTQGKLDLGHVRSVLGSYGSRANVPREAKADAQRFAKHLLELHRAEARGAVRKQPAKGRKAAVEPARRGSTKSRLTEWRILRNGRSIGIFVERDQQAAIRLAIRAGRLRRGQKVTVVPASTEGRRGRAA